ncbi:MAG TPA: sulfurtransferase-like selenium metabolism protein YedF [Spirochaetota bacterium]|nr:sulfurtransferase-like selenium metabolism protein YedF [Spirochaetota bacterium]HPV41182.1 sulfurtransferase-like selenium metabolism protein YedF [Spirochaetota bacterium]
MLHKVDARGLSCPQPVINATKALESNDKILVIVDNQTAFENIKRLATNKGCSVSEERKPNGIYIVLEKQGTPDIASQVKKDEILHHAIRDEKVLVISQDVLGKGDDTLGALLMKSFFHTMAETAPSPDVIIFLNSGVKLLTEGSPVLEDIQILEKKGTRLIGCGTCLDYFNLKDRLMAGSVSNMYEIKEMMLAASSTINL